MDDHFCPMCGVKHGDAAAEETEAAVIVDDRMTSADIEIAKINADKEIKLARIAAGMIDHDRDIEQARAEAKADVLQDVLTPEPEPEPEPIIIDAPEAIADDDAGEELPPVEGSPVPEPAKSKSRGLGMW